MYSKKLSNFLGSYTRFRYFVSQLVLWIGPNRTQTNPDVHSASKISAAEPEYAGPNHNPGAIAGAGNLVSTSSGLRLQACKHIHNDS
jgi:hypothetical protein